MLQLPASFQEQYRAIRLEQLALAFTLARARADANKEVRR